MLVPYAKYGNSYYEILLNQRQLFNQHAANNDTYPSAICTRDQLWALRRRAISVQENDSCGHFVFMTLKLFATG